jgi:hypothetical protein
MAYTITVNNMEVITTLDGLTDVVSTIEFQVDTETVIADNIYAVTGREFVTIPYPNPESFTPYDQLVESEVVAWIESNYPVEDLIDRLITLLRNQVIPHTRILTPPWIA